MWRAVLAAIAIVGLCSAANAQFVSPPGTTSSPSYAGLSLTGTALPTPAAGTLGVGGIASAPTLAANGEGNIYLSTAGGLLLQGQGSGSDIYFINKGGTPVAGLLTGSNMWGAGFDWVNQAGAGNRMHAAFDGDAAGNLLFTSVGSGTGKGVVFNNGGGVSIGATLVTVGGELGGARITASGSAPGAAGAKMEWVCGTGAGSMKLISYAGTSTTPVTVVDNVGSGGSGC